MNFPYKLFIPWTSLMTVDGFSGCGIVCSALAQTGGWSSWSDLGPCHSCSACIFLQCHFLFEGAKVNPRRKHLDPCPCTEVRWFEPDNTRSACAKILLVSKIQFHILSKIVFACFSYIQLPRKQGSLHGRFCKFHACWRSAYHTVEESNYGGLLSTCSFLRGAFHPGMENKCLGWLSFWFQTEQRAQEQGICTWAQTFHQPRIYNAGSSALTTYRNIHSKHVTPVIISPHANPAEITRITWDPTFQGFYTWGQHFWVGVLFTVPVVKQSPRHLANHRLTTWSPNQSALRSQEHPEPVWHVFSLSPMCLVGHKRNSHRKYQNVNLSSYIRRVGGAIGALHIRLVYVCGSFLIDLQILSVVAGFAAIHVMLYINKGSEMPGKRIT